MEILQTTGGKRKMRGARKTNRFPIPRERRCPKAMPVKGSRERALNRANDLASFGGKGCNKKEGGLRKDFSAYNRENGGRIASRKRRRRLTYPRRPASRAATYQGLRLELAAGHA